MIVHVATTIQTVFGIVDDQGNVIAQEPIVANVARFSEDAFADAHGMIAAERDKAQAVYEESAHAAR